MNPLGLFLGRARASVAHHSVPDWDIPDTSYRVMQVTKLVTVLVPNPLTLSDLATRLTSAPKKLHREARIGSQILIFDN